MSVVERKWAMVKVGKGDYLLPSNDGTVLFRISSYLEDGSLSQDGREVVGMFWCVHYRDIPGGDTDLWVNDEDFLEWKHWREYCYLRPTRKAAIEEALNRG